LRIGIVGAGLCGLASAALLARDGHAVVVLERARVARPIGAGLLLQPPGIAILRELGALQAVAAQGAPVRHLDSRAHGGARLLDLHYADLAPGLYGLGLTRPAIWAALLDVALEAGAELRQGCSVESLDGAADMAQANLADGQRLDFDLLVVAAGTHAGLWTGRPGYRTRLYPWGCLWATVRLPPGWPLDVLAQRCDGTGVMLGVLPISLSNGAQLGALYWSIRNDRVAAWRAAPFEDWRSQVARTWPEAGELLRGLTHADVEHATYRDVWAAPPHDGRMVVMGDAAHGTSPQLGQGTTQALRDAKALAEALRREGPLADRLAAYWQARRRRTAYYRLASRALTPVFQSDIPGLGWLRDRLAGPVGQIPMVRRQALLTLAGLKSGLWSADEPSQIPGA
jgi:2-polyprenyl-6-methoxyphenol hydroxylase-like FAD-dependent oxidoreductase